MRLPEALATDAAAFVNLSSMIGDATRYACRDGTLCAADVGKAAGISAKKAARAVKEYCRQFRDARDEGSGAVIEMDRDLVAPPGTMTRAELAVVVARKLGLGRFRIAGEVEKRAADRPPVRKERRVGTDQHPWKLGTHGRSIRGAAPGEGGYVATLACEKAGCVSTLDVRFRTLGGSSDMDRKFTQKGWEVDPARCPAHARHARERHTMTISKPPAANAAANGAMFKLLQEHFDPEAGMYAAGWSDAEVARQTGLAPEYVSAVRTEAMGPLREPPGVVELRSDLAAVEALLAEEEGRVRSIRDMVEGLKIKAADLTKRFAA